MKFGYKPYAFTINKDLPSMGRKLEKYPKLPKKLLASAKRVALKYDLKLLRGEEKHSCATPKCDVISF
jgi:hypothetical protein